MAPDCVKIVAEELRDELTEQSVALIYPMAMDAIASTPFLCRLLTQWLIDNSTTSLGEGEGR